MQETSEKPTTTTTSSSLLAPPREISFRRQQQFFFHQKAMGHGTVHESQAVYRGQTREEIPSDLEHVRVDPSMAVIDWDTFSGCKKLVTIEFPEKGVVSIRGRAFMDCYSLKPPKFPASLREIGDVAFSTWPPELCQSHNNTAIADAGDSLGDDPTAAIVND